MNKRKTPKTARKTFLKHSTGEILSFDSALAAARYLDISDRSLTKSFSTYSSVQIGGTYYFNYYSRAIFCIIALTLEAVIMEELKKFFAIVNKASQTTPIYSDEYWNQQNKEISAIHKEFVERVESERVDSELLNQQFTI